MKDTYFLRPTNVQFQDLYLCFCGISECEPCHSFGPAICPNYILHYILSGKGNYQVGERKYTLQQGQGFLIEPETVIFYQADAKKPWTYLWVGFSGMQAEMFLEDLGLNASQHIFQSKYGEELRRIVNTMISNHSGSQTNQYYLQSLLYEFFAVLTKDAPISVIMENKRESIYVKKAINFIRNNYFREIGVAEIAAYIGVSESNLYELFQENLKVSPKEFLTRLRIMYARELLELTGLTIECIVISCGFQNVSIFSKEFEQVVGKEPNVYRKLYHRNHQDKIQKQQWEMMELLETF